MRLLLIEDHQRFANFVKDGLEKEGFTVDCVNTAATGEAAQATVQYDSIILDLGLPDQDGLDLLRSWREDGSKTPVLILTARDGIDERVKDEAAAVLASIGLTVSDAFRLMLVRVAAEKKLPFEPLVPNEETVEAMRAARRGDIVEVGKLDDLLADLNADD